MKRVVLSSLLALFAGCTALLGDSLESKGHSDQADAGAIGDSACSCATPPEAQCLDQSTLRSYSAGCSAGACAFLHSDTLCENGCENGVCTGNDPCSGIVCNSPPAASCTDANTLTTTSSSGTCSAGTCSYTSSTTACENGCVSGSCQGDPCAGITCDQPPAAVCSNANTRRSFAGTGTCASGSCSYSPIDTTCADGCSAGACNGDPCAGVTCDQPPAATCVSSITRRTYSEAGTCGSGACSYTSTDAACTAPAHATAACTSGACDFTCDSGYTKSGSACVVSNITVSQISVGDRHACAVVTGGVKCWGSNAWGELGNNSTTDSHVAVQVQGLTSGVTAVSAGADFTCAIVNGGVQCWGYNHDGQLGNNSTAESNVPVQVQGLTSGVTSISAGSNEACALVNGSAQCWGSNSFGQLGNNSSAVQSSVPVQVQGLTSGVTSISVSLDFACAVVNGGVQCWGQDPFLSESKVPVAVQGWASGVTAVSVGEDASCAIVSGGVQCWGYNNYGQLGDNNAVQNTHLPVAVQGLSSGVSALSVGSGSACVVVNGGAQCWGDNRFGQLGDDLVATAYVPVAVQGLSSGVTAVSMGIDEELNYNSACAVVGSGVQCWGSNSYGELGNNSINGSLIPVPVQF